jgi:hypothetical protein
MKPIASPPAAPVGQQVPPRARRCVSRAGTPQRARVPPVDYGDGLRALDADPER